MNQAKPASDPIVAETVRLANATVDELVERFVELYGKAPRCKRRDDLWRRCVWKLQENAAGGLSGVATRRLAALQSEIRFPIAESRATSSQLAGSKQHALLPGTVLVKTWHDERFEVRVEENGFLFDGKRFKSLSAIAKAITGSAWSGALFFELRDRKKAKE